MYCIKYCYLEFLLKIYLHGDFVKDLRFVLKLTFKDLGFKENGGLRYG